MANTATTAGSCGGLQGEAEAPSVETTSTGRGRSETLIPSRKTPAQADVWQKIAVAFGFSFEHSGNVLADHQAGDPMLPPK